MKKLEAYNTLYGIKETLKTYEAFANMVFARHKAYYERKEELEEFVLFGALRLDTCGNIWKLDKKVTLPDVVTREDFQAIYDNSSCYLWSIPRATVNCAFCGQGWHTDTLDFIDHHRVTKSEEIEDIYAGLTVKEANQKLREKTDASYYLEFDKNEENNIIDKNEKLFCSVSRYFHDECMNKFCKEEANRFFAANGKIPVTEHLRSSK